jgi:glutathione S-transferase
MSQRLWAAGQNFSMADCAAAPSLFYAATVAPFPASHTNLAAYFERLLQRPSFARALEEAKPYFRFFPFREALPARFLESSDS